MNTTTSRRIVTSLLGLGLAASAFAATGPNAVAAKPGGGSTTQPLTIDTYHFRPSETGPVYEVGIYYTAPVAPKNVKSVTCTLDGAAVDDCGWLLGGTRETSARYQQAYFPVEGVVPVEHTFTVKVVAGKTTYAGSSTFTLGF